MGISRLIGFYVVITVNRAPGEAAAGEPNGGANCAKVFEPFWTVPGLVRDIAMVSHAHTKTAGAKVNHQSDDIVPGFAKSDHWDDGQMANDL